MSMNISARRKHGAHTFQAKFIQAYDKVYQFALNEWFLTFFTYITVLSNNNNRFTPDANLLKIRM